MKIRTADEIFANGDTRYLMARKLAAFFNDSGHSRGDATEWNKALTVVGTEWKTISKCLGYIDTAATGAENIIDFVFLMITLQDCSKTTVNMLLHEVQEGTNLYEGLVQVQGSMNLPLTEFFMEYIKEEVLNKVAGSLKKLGTTLLDHVMKNLIWSDMYESFR